MVTVIAVAVGVVAVVVCAIVAVVVTDGDGNDSGARGGEGYGLWVRAVRAITKEICVLAVGVACVVMVMMLVSQVGKNSDYGLKR